MTTTSNQTKTTPYTDRQGKLIAILKKNRFSSLILNACPSLTYLTGLHFHLSERPVLAFFMPDRYPMIVLPELEQEKLKNLPFSVESFPYGEDPKQWGAEFIRAVKTAKLGGKRNGE